MYLTLGCSKCLHQFTRNGPFGTKPDYSGYDEKSWVPRTKQKHIELSLKHQAAKTQTEAKDIEQESGLRYSELIRLPYYDPIRCHLVDPMHCLLLGVAKHTLKVWIEVSYLNTQFLFYLFYFIPLYFTLSLFPDLEHSNSLTCHRCF